MTSISGYIVTSFSTMAVTKWWGIDSSLKYACPLVAMSDQQWEQFWVCSPAKGMTVMLWTYVLGIWFIIMGDMPEQGEAIQAEIIWIGCCVYVHYQLRIMWNGLIPQTLGCESKLWSLLQYVVGSSPIRIWSLFQVTVLREAVISAKHAFPSSASAEWVYSA